VTRKISLNEKKIRANVPTSNYFDDLPSEMEDTMEEVSHEVTCLSRAGLNRSCPDITTNNCFDCETLQLELTELQQKYASADNEIEFLSAENNRLKRELQKHELKIDKLKTICASTETTPIMKSSSLKKHVAKRQTKINRLSLVSSRTGLDLDSDDDTPQCTPLQIRLDVQDEQDEKCTPVQIRHDEQNKILTNTDHLLEGIKQRSETHKTKTKLCIISNQRYIGTLTAIENAFDCDVDYCHHIVPNCGISDILKTLSSKLQNFTLSDYCTIFLGEIDFNGEQDNTELVRNIRSEVQKITNTNVIICLPTYICGAPIYNFIVEAFGTALIQDMQKDYYCYIFDTNSELSFDMFSYYSGKINKHGTKNVFLSLKKYITDMQTFFREQ
jgi:hypothetical protein